MDIINVADVGGTEFPAGRRTRVLVGPDAPLEAERFVMGHVTIYPGGSVPLHSHEQEEVYFIAAGEGSITVNEEIQKVRTGDCIYIRPQKTHMLKNTTTENLIMMFCYAPKKVAEHWAEELKGGDNA
ncbi:MAG: cupin domain-containing protein [Veillonellaceae bacterium]|nr:cupin domain-containing protein [Veillonellaceae bacterium]